jgi:PIN domain nuclease of toxin-antitoxin system
MKLLLDTNVVLWLLASEDRVPEWLRTATEESNDVLLVSEVSLWEIAIKSSPCRIEVPDHLPEVIDRSGGSRHDINQSHTRKVRDVEFHLPDPYDRLLVAQALVEELTVVRRDRDLASFGAAIPCNPDIHS